jgi:hypothetical protein
MFAILGLLAYNSNKYIQYHELKLIPVKLLRRLTGEVEEVIYGKTV